MNYNPKSFPLVFGVTTAWKRWRDAQDAGETDNTTRLREEYYKVQQELVSQINEGNAALFQTGFFYNIPFGPTVFIRKAKEYVDWDDQGLLMERIRQEVPHLARDLITTHITVDERLDDEALKRLPHDVLAFLGVRIEPVNEIDITPTPEP